MAPVENKVWYLKRSRLFERASDETLAGCEHLFTQVAHRKRSRLFEQGDVGRTVFLIKMGRVRIGRETEDGKEITIALLRPGDLFGEEVLFEADVARTTVATCLEDTLLCTARAEDLFGLLSRSPVLAINMAKYLSEQRDEALSIAEEFAYAKVPDRLIKLLERLGEQYGKRIDDGVLIDVRLTHADLASLIGSSRETVSMQLSQFAREGRIAMHGRQIVVRHAVTA